MATIYVMKLTNTQGLSQVLQFDGLGIKITICPSVETLAEPVITRQAFYFLENLESVAKMRLENDSAMFDMIDERQISSVMEYIIDNYLFTYSLANEESKLSSKTDRYGLLNTTPKDWYYLADQANTKYLAIDTLNDESVVECHEVSDQHETYESDWRIFYYYFSELNDKYVKEVRDIFEKKIYLKTRNNSSKEQVLPIIQFIHNPYEFWELEKISNVEYIEKNDPNLSDEVYDIYPYYFDKSKKISIPMSHYYSTNFYHKYLLDLYFAGLRQHSLVIKFKHFYNVLEYFFEDAALHECKNYLPKKIAKTILDFSNVNKWKTKLNSSFPYNRNKILSEQTHLKILLNMTIDKNKFINKIKNYDSEISNHFITHTPVNKSVLIEPLDLTNPTIIDTYATRIYDIRNRIIHTKRIKQGQEPPVILPFSENEKFFLKNEVLLLKFVAQEVIQRERDIFKFTSLSFSPYEIGLFTELLFENENSETFVSLFGDFIFNLSTKLPEADFTMILDRLTFILTTIIDQARLEVSAANIDNIRKKVTEIDCDTLHDAAKYVIECIAALLNGDVKTFNESIDNIQISTTRHNLYRLQNSLGLPPFYEGEK